MTVQPKEKEYKCSRARKYHLSERIIIEIVLLLNLTFDSIGFGFNNRPESAGLELRLFDAF